jgi:hypothetical protein|tara:strand:- start:555 stop:707 length:153 start_codon:yes stop_codon:yes gene_type:complete
MNGERIDVKFHMMTGPNKDKINEQNRARFKGGDNKSFLYLLSKRSDDRSE